jgi:hypothetical protein
MRTLKRHLQSVDAVATTSPSPPRPALARCSQDHRFDIQKISPKIISLIPQIFLLFSMEIPHYIGFGGLTTMERITH